MSRYWFYCLVLITCCFNCTSKDPVPFQKHAAAEDFEEAKQVSPQLAEGFELNLWAPGPLLSNAVALTFDPSGAAYIAETSRRKSSDLDIRSHRDWMTDDIALQSIDDTRDFLMKALADSLSDQNTWLEDFTGDSIRDYNDLAVQTEYINKVWDSDGDGRADISQQFAAGFNTMVTGIAAGILHFDDRIYLAVAPDLWVLEDTDQDGKADRRQSLSHGYGIHIAFAGHDMSGLTIGPDGRIYWSIGDLGINVTGPDGRNWKYPNQGSVMRCNPDGSDFEVFAHGLRNPQELAFDPYGNLISVDNDGDHPGEHERYVHIIEGSDSGWRIHWQYGKYNLPNESYKVWMDEKLHIPHFSGQAAYITPALALAYDGPAGLAFNPGTALNEKWNDYFFASYFTGSSARSKIEAFQISPKGSSFEIKNIQDVVGGIVPTGITFAADGALYINDWKDSYDKKPEGRIWKLDVPPGEKNKLRVRTQKLLQEGMSDRNFTELESLLAYPDQRIRMSSQFEIVKRGGIQNLIKIAKSNTDLFARLHAIWGVSQLARRSKRDLSSMLPLLKDNNPHVRGQVSKLFGEAKNKIAENELIRLISDESASVQFFAVEALGKIESARSFDQLVLLLEKIKESDPHLRHAVVFAMSKLATVEQLAALADHPSVYVRIGAVVSLRHMRASEVSAFLNDRDNLVLDEAARAINDDFSIPGALPALAKTLTSRITKNEAFTRRAINANLRIGDAAGAQRLASFAMLASADLSMRQDALWALGYWANPPKLDRVTGRYRDLAGHQVADARAAFADIFPATLEKKNSEILTAAIETAGRLKYKDASAAIAHLFNDSSRDVAVRSAALTALDQLAFKDLIGNVDLALSDKDIEIRKLAQDILGHLDIDEEKKLPLFQKILKENTWSEKQIALAALGKMTSDKTKDFLSSIFEKLKVGQLEPEIQLDLLKAIDQSQFTELKKLKADYENSHDPNNKLEEYQSTLYGGNVKRGSNIFRRNSAAQCIRCHALNGNGGGVGPDLANIGTILSREQLLLSLVDPSARIAPGFGTVSLVLKNNEEIVGILLNETDEVVLVKEGDQITEYARSGIESIEVSPSAMFNTAEVLDKEQIRDVLAYLVTLQ